MPQRTMLPHRSVSRGQNPTQLVATHRYCHLEMQMPVSRLSPKCHPCNIHIPPRRGVRAKQRLIRLLLPETTRCSCHLTNNHRSYHHRSYHLLYPECQHRHHRRRRKQVQPRRVVNHCPRTWNAHQHHHLPPLNLPNFSTKPHTTPRLHHYTTNRAHTRPGHIRSISWLNPPTGQAFCHLLSSLRALPQKRLTHGCWIESNR